jgi:hypothetical protein
MADTHTPADTQETTTPIPLSDTPAPGHHSPVDQMKDVAKRLRAIVTGHSGS